jgi:hypothetical protein
VALTAKGASFLSQNAMPLLSLVSGSTGLAYLPYPSLEEVNSYADFHAEEISAAEFNALWESVS